MGRESNLPPVFFLMKGRARHISTLLLAGCGTLAGQAGPVEAPRHLTGALVFGWMDTVARETLRERLKNPFTTLRLDYQSYLLNPDFLSYRVQPRLSSGFQDGFSGVSEGSGIALEAAFLQRRPWPFRFRYSRFRRPALTTGLIASYAKFISQNDDSTLGFAWQYLASNATSFDISYDKVSSATTPESVLAQGFETRSGTLSISGRDFRKGWSMNGSLSLQRLDSRFLLGSDAGSLLLDTRSKIKNLMFFAQRPVRSNLNFLFSGNRTTNRSEYDRGRFFQGYDSLSGKLDYKPSHRLQTWVLGRLTRSTLESTVSPTLAGSVLTLPATEISNRMVDAEIRFEIHSSLSFFGKNEFSHVRAPGTGLTQRPGTFNTTGAGLQFFKSRNGLVVASNYHVYTTLTDFAGTPAAHLIGQSVDSSVAAGEPRRIRVSGEIGLNRSRESYRSLLPFTSDSERARVAIGRTLFRRWTLELQGGLSRIRYTRQELRSDFRGKDYGASLTAPRYFMSYNRSTGSGDSFQPLLGLPPVTPGGPLLLVIGSSSSTTTMTASWHPARAITLRAIWRGQVQSVGARHAARFEQQEAVFDYRFRRILLEAGYLVYRFDFGAPIYRRSVIGRVTREFQVF